MKYIFVHTNKGGFKGGPSPRPCCSGIVFSYVKVCRVVLRALLLNVSALHVQYGIQAFAKFKRPEFTKLHLRELQSQKFSLWSMRPKLP